MTPTQILYNGNHIMFSPRLLLTPLALTLGVIASVGAATPVRASWPVFNHFGHPGNSPGQAVQGGPPIIYQQHPYSQPVIIAPDPGPGTSVIYQQRTYFPRVYAPSGFQQVQPNYYPYYQPYYYPAYPGGGRGRKF